MQAKFAPEHDKMVGGHWNWDDATSKAHFDYGVKFFGSPDNRYTKQQWFAQLIYYIRYISPLTDQHVLTKEETMEWVKLAKAAMEARKWANPKCTPEMIKDCDMKIR